MLTEEIKRLSKSEIQSVVTVSNKKALKTNGLKFIYEYGSIGLTQHILYYRIVGRNKVNIYKVTRPVHVRGLEQIENLQANTKYLTLNL